MVNAGEIVEKGELPCTTGGWEYKSIQPPWRTAWRFLKKQGINLPYDQVSAFLISSHVMLAQRECKEYKVSRLRCGRLKASSV